MIETVLVQGMTGDKDESRTGRSLPHRNYVSNSPRLSPGTYLYYLRGSSNGGDCMCGTVFADAIIVLRKATWFQTVMS